MKQLYFPVHFGHCAASSKQGQKKEIGFSEFQSPVGIGQTAPWQV
ncbi:hypothetical protein [Rufibacter sp. XAAS-G3-1]|nr:hypothetical protein [Rufibacter sp. XAAS-G3-1]